MRINIDTNRIDPEQIMAICIIVAVCVIGFLIIWAAVCFSSSSKDEKEELITKRVRIREKVDQSMLLSGAWYIVAREDGTRLKLRNLKENNVIVAMGDVGILQYRGETIYSFQAEPSMNQANF